MRTFLLLAIFLSLTAQLCAGTVTGIITSPALNVRIKPGLDRSNSVVATLKKGDEVKVIKEVEGWCEIEIPESAAVWVHGENLKDDVVQKEINLRSGPGVAYAPYPVKAKQGQKLEVIRKSTDNWVKVKPMQGMTAWISSEFVKLPEAEKISAKTEDKKGPDAKTEAPAEAPKEKTDEKKPGNPPKDETAKDKEPPKDVKKSLVTKEGFVLPVKSDLETVSHALATREKGEYTVIYYLRSSKMNLKNWENQKVKITGYESSISGWKHPILDVETVTPFY